jgi:hypothetical protein
MTFAQRRTMALVLASVTIACGLALRLSHLPLPFAAYKYGGSMLWAAAIYWLVIATFPRWNVTCSAVASTLLAAGIEFFKLYHTPAMDAFRLTLAGKLILGRVFSWKDIAAYLLAIAIAALLDNTFFRRRLQPSLKA